MFQPFISSFQKQSYGNLGSSNEGLSIQVTAIENHGAISSLSQFSVQSKTSDLPLMALPFLKKKTFDFEQTTISQLKSLSERSIRVSNEKSSTQTLEIFENQQQVSGRLGPQSLPILPLLKSNQSIKSTLNNVHVPINKIQVVNKSKYWELLEECQKENKIFTDEQFPPNEKSMGDANYIKNQRGYAGWERISKIVPGAVFVNSYNIQDAVQGSLNNCYFVSSIASIAKDFPNLFDKIFVSNKISPYAIYMARFYAEGILVQIVIDDYVPVSIKKEPYYARPSSQKQIWAMILEKCWAKFFKSYQRTDRGRPQQAFYALTGAPFGIKALKSTDKDTQLKQFIKLYKFQQKGNIFGTFTPKFTKQNEFQGLVSLHAYSVLSIITHPIGIVKLRNPTGQNLYKKNLANEIILEYGKQKGQKYLDELHQKGHDLEAVLKDGIFYMDYREFMQKFESITVCQINNNLNLLSLRCNFTKNKAKFFYFDLTRQSPIVVCISQMFQKMGQNFKSNDDSYYSITKLILAKITSSSGKESSSKKSSEHQSSNDKISIDLHLTGKKSLRSNQQYSKSSVSSISQMNPQKYEFIGARSNVSQTAFNFLMFSEKNNREDKQKVFKPGRYVIYASANIQRASKKDFTLTVYNNGSCFPQEINDFGELYSEKTNSIISMMESLGIVDSNEKFEKRWLEEVFLSKVNSERSMKNLKDYEMFRQRSVNGKLANPNEYKVQKQQSWFSCRIPWLMQLQKMGGFGYFACYLSKNHNSIENFTFEIKQLFEYLSKYYGRFVEIVTTDKGFNLKDKVYTMSIRPGQTRIVVLKLNYDKENFMKVMAQYPLGKNDIIHQRAPLPARSSLLLSLDKKVG